jgi:hypothetical protein
MIRTSARGATDIAEEIPSILVVIVATFLFLMTVAETVVSYSRFQDERLLDDKMSSFCDSVLSYEPLLYDSTYGQLDSTKLNEKTRSRLQEDYDPRLLGFHYNITILDVSLYEETYIWSAGEDSRRSSVRVQSLVPAIVCNELGERHSIILRMVIWR